MTVREMQIEFERRVQTFNKEALANEKFTSDTIIAYLNEAIDKFYKTRYSGINLRRTGFEQELKRIDDLRNLIDNKKYSTTATSDSDKIKNSDDNCVYTVTLPEEYAFLLGDTAGIQPVGDNECWPGRKEKDEDGKETIIYDTKYTDTLESTIETSDRQKADPLSEYHLKYCSARPLKLIQNNTITLYTDGQYQVSEYNITYLKLPSKLTSADLTKKEDYADFPTHAHMEIVKIAVELYMATKPVQNYSVYAGEVQTME